MSEKVTIGNATLYRGDCMDILPTLDKVDAVVTDPPYGIGESGGNKARYRSGDGRRKDMPAKHEDYGWDKTRPPAEFFGLALSVAGVCIFWGGNYFADLLPPSMGWLYWDKRMGGDFSDGELAYTSQQAALRAMSIHPFKGLAGGKNRVHPTQKPVPLMEWSIQQCKKSPQTILDPFMGSGTTGVACMNLGRKFIGIELEQKYFDIACERIEAAQAQGRLFQ